MDYPPPIDRHSIVEISHSFHRQAGTETTPVRDNLEAYGRGVTSVRVAHQANWLPSVNVVAQPKILDTLTRLTNTNSAQLFVILDYDAQSDRRYRHAHFPSPSHIKGYASLSVPHRFSNGDGVMFTEYEPPVQSISDFGVRLRAIVHQDSALARRHGIRFSKYRLDRNITTLESELQFARENADLLSDMNAIYLSRVVNLCFGLPIAFVKGREALPLLAAHMEYLWIRAHELSAIRHKAAQLMEELGLSVSPSMVGEVDLVPFWIRCDCGRRVPLYWTANRSLIAVGSCSKCELYYRVGTKEFRRLADGGVVIPRILIDDLLDGFAWNHQIGSSYQGGIQHYVFSTIVATMFGLRALPEFLSCRSSTDLTDVISDLYSHFLGELIALGSNRAIASAELLRTGRASIAHTSIWGQLGSGLIDSGFLSD
jgi:hypothetical protein